MGEGGAPSCGLRPRPRVREGGAFSCVWRPSLRPRAPYAASAAEQLEVRAGSTGMGEVGAGSGADDGFSSA
eukprot:3612349-Alexandrium_andersonii.AAC.1